MKLKGVNYDVGSVMYFNWRPDFDTRSVSREIEIIKNDLHCNAIRITGLDIKRLIVATEIALKQGLEVWLCPTMWNKRHDETQAYTVKVAESAEKLRRDYTQDLVFVVGGELTLFMQGIVEGKNVMERVTKLFSKYTQQENSGEKTNSDNAISRIQNGEHNKILRAYLQETVSLVKEVFHGKITYASLLWESVDWNLFDYVALDHYRAEKIKDRYAEMLKPAFEIGKPVVVTEFGMPTFKGAEINGAGLGGNIIDDKAQALHYMLPLFGKFIRLKLRDGNYIRDEGLQRRELEDQLSVLDNAGIYGSFVSVFVSQIHPYDENPRYDLDMASMSLVKTYTKGRHGVTYPDMNWEPKESFRAVADYYLKH